MRWTSSWMEKKMARAVEESQSSGRSLQEVCLNRFGDLEHLPAVVHGLPARRRREILLVRQRRALHLAARRVASAARMAHGQRRGPGMAWLLAWADLAATTPHSATRLATGEWINT